MITGRMFGDPGPCPVDDTPHTACVGPTPHPLTQVMLPARDGVRPPRLQVLVSATPTGPTFTTATYRGWPLPRRR